MSLSWLKTARRNIKVRLMHCCGWSWGRQGALQGKNHELHRISRCKEAETIGQLLGVQPLLGERATRDVVLQAIYPVILIRVVAHGNVDTGEIALLPCPTVKSASDEEGYLLRISDISEVKVRAKLVLLSWCHSGNLSSESDSCRCTW